jgi:hypothetical protein
MIIAASFIDVYTDSPVINHSFLLAKRFWFSERKVLPPACISSAAVLLIGFTWPFMLYKFSIAVSATKELG